MSERPEEEFRYLDGSAPEDRPRDAQGRFESHTEPSEPEEDFTHYVHTADGSVHKHWMREPLGSHYSAKDEEDIHGGHAIIGVYPR